MPTETKHTKKQVDLMLTTLAYICTHPNDWNQGTWRCGSGMCFAGHAAITLGGLTPVMADPNKSTAGLADYVYLPKRMENSHWVLSPRTLNYFLDDAYLDEEGKKNIIRKRMKVSDISDAAQALLGLDNRKLFGGSNSITDIVDIIGDELDLTEQEVQERAHEIAKREGWRWPRKELNERFGITW